MDPVHTFARLRPGHETALAPTPEGHQAGHWWSDAELRALTFALAARRPLLVRGEPGSGKSQIAWAAAAEWGLAAPIAEVIHPKYEATDLLYHFDAVHRLADSQVRDDDGKSLLDPTNERYVRHGPIWSLFNESSAGRQAVLLIDEIDKSDADVPNTLLDVLGNRAFDVPMLKGRRIRSGDSSWPLILITTNGERELPAAFVRRCAVLNLNPPDGDRELKAWLLQRATAHPPFRGLNQQVLDTAIEMVLDDRRAAFEAGYPPVGLAELVDLLQAVVRLCKDEPDPTQAQVGWLAELRPYALVKYAAQTTASGRRSPAGDREPPADPADPDAIR